MDLNFGNNVGVVVMTADEARLLPQDSPARERRRPRRAAAVSSRPHRRWGQVIDCPLHG